MEDLNISEWFHQVADQVEEARRSKRDELLEMMKKEFDHVFALQKQEQNLTIKTEYLNRLRLINEISLMLAKNEMLSKVKERIQSYLDYLKDISGGNLTIIS